MKKLLVSVAAILLFSLPLTAFAQNNQASSEDRDALEFNLSGSWVNPMGAVKTWNDTLGAKSGFGIGTQLGLFLSPNIVLGVSCRYFRMGIDNTLANEDQKHQVYAPSVYLKYLFFGEGNLVPYVYGNAGADFIKFSTLVQDNLSWKYRELGYKPALAVGAGAGLFLYRTDYSGFFIEGSFNHGFSKDVKKNFQGVDYTFGEDVNFFAISAGIQVFFSGK